MLGLQQKRMNKHRASQIKGIITLEVLHILFSDEPLKAEIVQIEVEDGFTNLTI